MFNIRQDNSHVLRVPVQCIPQFHRIDSAGWICTSLKSKKILQKFKRKTKTKI